ncbi:MAG: hypothetical protein HY040_20245 [Planctomycetes bacterium]|nr:hypothetical protein [Planctomycetota bacterium]
MNSDWDTNWNPGPELLAAYVDGEFEGRDELASLRVRVENWLTRHPHAQEELAHYRKLRRLWLATTPDEPCDRVWRQTQENLQRLCGQPLQTQRQSQKKSRGVRPSRRWFFSALTTLAACLALVVAWKVTPKAKNLPFAEAPLDFEMFPVATDDEVEILRVDGEDASSVVRGELPAIGPLELTRPNDVMIRSVQPHGRDSALPRILKRGPDSPMMFWTRTDSEK